MISSLERPAGSTPVIPTSRIASIDLIRGGVMILMAIDHARVYSGLPPGGPSARIFFTRWITHFCAPAFIFLAGTSAFLYGRRHRDLSRFLFVRGLWLVLLELTVIRVAWTFNFDFRDYLLAGVIWVIGWCMVLMAGLMRLPVPAVGALGVATIALHNAVMPKVVPLLPGALRKILYTAFAEPPIGPLMVLYSIVPWIGVMALGYAFGRVVTLEPARRHRICYTLGLGSTALFLGLLYLGGPWRSSSCTSRAGGSPISRRGGRRRGCDFSSGAHQPLIATAPAVDCSSCSRWVSSSASIIFLRSIIRSA